MGKRAERSKLKVVKIKKGVYEAGANTGNNKIFIINFRVSLEKRITSKFTVIVFQRPQTFKG